MGSGNVPVTVHNESAPNVEIREATGQSHVEPVQAGNRIAEGVARNRCRASVNALSPGISALDLEAMAHALGQLQFESVKVGAPLIEHSADRPEGRVDGIRRIASVWPADKVSVDIYLGPEIAGGGLGRDDQIGFIHAERLMHATRSYVGNHGRKVRSQLVL